jgi:hypothetical protein
VLVSLIKAGREVLAYQLAFDLYVVALFVLTPHPKCRTLVREHSSRGPQPRAHTHDNNSVSRRFDSATQQFLSSVSNGLNTSFGQATPAVGDGAAEEAPVASGDDIEPAVKETLEKVLTILSGDLTLALSVEFLSRNNHADKLLMNNIKDTVGRNSITHNATVMANAMM